jgi:Arc/MetJ family transcription regulator
MRRGIALARDYASKRTAFGAPLAAKALHLDTLAGMQAELEAAFHLTFFLVEMIGRDEAGTLGAEERELLRLLTPIVKLTTAKQCVAVVSEALECFGGAGYVEDTGLPMLLRDSQVFPIWEGTTNVLSLDALRAVGSGSALEAVGQQLRKLVHPLGDTRLAEPARHAAAGFASAVNWLEAASARGTDAVESGARRFALTLGRSLALALVVRHAQWAVETEHDERPLAAAHRFSRQGVDVVGVHDFALSRSLALD